MKTARPGLLLAMCALIATASACAPPEAEPTVPRTTVATVTPALQIPSPTTTGTSPVTPSDPATAVPTPSISSTASLTSPLQQTQIEMPFAMEWSPSGDPIAVTTGQGLLLLDPEDISEASLLETEKPLRALAFHPNGDRLATADQGVNVFIYDSSSGDRLETLAPSINGAHALFYNRRGNLVIAVHGGPADYVGIGSYGDDTAFGFSAIPNATRDNPLALHPTDNQVAVYIFGQIEIWDQPEEPTNTFEAPFAADLEFRPDGSLLAAPHRDCKLRLWDPETGEVIRTFDWCESPDESMGIVDFSSDGRLLAVADGQGTILVWDIDKEQTHQEIRLASGRVLGLAFDPTGDRLASLHEDGLLQIWAIEP